MLKLLLGDPNARKLKRSADCFRHQLAGGGDCSSSDDQLREKTASFSSFLPTWGLANQRPILEEMLPEAFAVREASKGLGMRHFDVQLIGGMVLHEGQIAEMKTGEGKTLWPPSPLPQRPYRSWCPCSDGE